MTFNLGDYITPIKLYGMEPQGVEIGKVYKVGRLVDGYDGIPWFWINNYGHYNSRWFRKITVDNPINRKLYPDYKEYKGFLVPADFRAVLIEEE